MPYLPHLKISVFGRLGDTFQNAQETWSVGLRYAPVSGAYPSLDQNAMDNIATSAFAASAAFINSSTFSDNVHFEGCKAYNIGPDGKAVGAIGASFVTTAIHGTGTSQYQPYQVADVLSFVADGRGKGKYGRIYLPGLNADIQKDGLRPVSFGPAFTGLCRTWLNAIDSGIATGPRFGRDVALVIAGTTGSGTLRAVSTLRMGRVPDTQRRRRRSLVEGYSELAYGTE